MRSLYLFFPILVLFLVASCNEANTLQENGLNEETQNIDFTTIAEGYYGNISDTTLVIRDNETFSEFWTELYSSQEPTPKIPNINFASHIVIATAMPRKSTGGFKTEITKIYLLKDTLGVNILNSVPGSGCGTTQALSTPYHLIRAERYDSPVIFTKKTKEVDCTN